MQCNEKIIIKEHKEKIIHTKQAFTFSISISLDLSFAEDDIARRKKNHTFVHIQ